MQLSLFPVLMILALVAEGAEQPTIHFGNGDSLPGAISRMEDGKLIWKSPALKSETPFFLNKVQEVTFPYVDPPATSNDHIAHIRFNQDLRQQNEKISGDIIQGELMAVTNESITLKTWYAGVLTLNRNMVKDLEINDVSPPIYTGPVKEDDWEIIPEKSWSFDKNTYFGTGNGSIAREFKTMPKRYCFSFMASWKNRFGIQLLFCADDAKDQNPDSHYMIVLDNGTSYLQKRSNDPNAANGLMRNGGMIGEYKRDQSFRNKDKSLMRLYVDTTSGLIALFSDETLIQQWNDTDQPFLSGKCIHLRQNAGSGYKIGISRLSLTEWDGTLPASQEGGATNPIENPEPAEGEQRITLRNGDILLGKVEKIENSEISLKTRYNELKLPVARIKSLALTPAEYDERLLQNGDVRAWFPDGSYITFRLDSISAEGKYRGSSQHFGKAEFDPAAFSRIEFNIYPTPAGHK